eukprot:m.42107 g.42107  ORF g.42107 m.42107 type:complete len:1265 (+) comp11516_c0_seq1:809-4603(+)
MHHGPHHGCSMPPVDDLRERIDSKPRKKKVAWSHLVILRSTLHNSGSDGPLALSSRSMFGWGLGRADLIFAAAIMVAAGCVCGADGAEHLDSDSDGDAVAVNCSLAGNDSTLRIVLLAHSHCDPGWRRTFEQYQSVVDGILDSVVAALERDSKRTFVWSENSFFVVWWSRRSEAVHVRVRALLRTGQLEFVGGGFVMHDEATTSFDTVLASMTEGLVWLDETFGSEGGRPHYGFQIDPFGHSALTASVFKALRFRGTVLNRVHYRTKASMHAHALQQFYWNGPNDPPDTHDDLVATLLPDHYTTPLNLDFETKGPLPAARLPDVANRLIALWREQLKGQPTNVLLVPIGDDFRFGRHAENQFSGWERLAHYINSNQSDKLRELDLTMDVGWGTLASYHAAVVASADPRCHPATPRALSPVTMSFFPYSPQFFDHWSGFYGSRPQLKQVMRRAERALKGAQLLLALCWSRSLCNVAAMADWPSLRADHLHHQPLGSTSPLGLLKMAEKHILLLAHHDAGTGTSSKLVTNDYHRRLEWAEAAVEQVSKLVLERLLQAPGLRRDALSSVLATESSHSSARCAAVVLFDPLGQPRHNKLATLDGVPASGGLTVLDSRGSVVPAQVLPAMPDAGLSRRVVFEANVPSLGLGFYWLCCTAADDDANVNAGDGAKEDRGNEAAASRVRAFGRRDKRDSRGAGELSRPWREAVLSLGAKQTDGLAAGVVSVAAAPDGLHIVGHDQNTVSVGFARHCSTVARGGCYTLRTEFGAGPGLGLAYGYVGLTAVLVLIAVLRYTGVSFFIGKPSDPADASTTSTHITSAMGTSATTGSGATGTVPRASGLPLLSGPLIGAGVGLAAVSAAVFSSGFQLGFDSTMALGAALVLAVPAAWTITQRHTVAAYVKMSLWALWWIVSGAYVGVFLLQHVHYLPLDDLFSSAVVVQGPLVRQVHLFQGHGRGTTTRVGAVTLTLPLPMSGNTPLALDVWDVQPAVDCELVLRLKTDKPGSGVEGLRVDAGLGLPLLNVARHSSSHLSEYPRMLLPAKFFPFTTAAALTRKGDHVIALVTQASSGASNLAEGMLDVMVGRRPNRDDGQGLGEACGTSRPLTRAAFKLVSHHQTPSDEFLSEQQVEHNHPIQIWFGPWQVRPVFEQDAPPVVAPPRGGLVAPLPRGLHLQSAVVVAPTQGAGALLRVRVQALVRSDADAYRRGANKAKEWVINKLCGPSNATLPQKWQLHRLTDPSFVRAASTNSSATLPLCSAELARVGRATSQ